MADLALSIAGLAVGIPGLLQVIGALGKALLQRIKHSDDQYHKEFELVIRTTKSQAQEICLYLHHLGQSVPESLNDDILQIFQALRNTFERLLHLIPVTNPGGQKPKLSATTKTKIDAEIRTIQDWNTRMFHRAMVFVNFGAQKTASTAQVRDSPDEYRAVALKRVEALRESVEESLDKAKHESNLLLLNPSEEEWEQTVCTALRNSSLEVRKPKTDGKSVLVEYRTHSDSALEPEILKQRRIVREVARILRQADPELMGLLYCDGFRWDSLKCRFELQFPIPPGLQNPRTLLDLLTDSAHSRSGGKHPLNQGIDLARSIVIAVFVLHSASLVHKQIRPDNVVIFESSPSSTGNSGAQRAPERQGYPYVLGKPFLVGFDNVRKVDAASLLLPVEDWKKNIYLSPRRQRLQPGDEFEMQDDMYSVGVVLIEIAFWSSFQDKSAPQLGKLVWQDASQSTLKGPEQLKKTYMSLAAGAVPRKMGQKYADIVMACLTGLESEQDGLKRLEDEDGIVVGTRYMVEVISKLEEISM